MPSIMALAPGNRAANKISYLSVEWRSTGSKPVTHEVSCVRFGKVATQRGVSSGWLIETKVEIPYFQPVPNATIV